MLKGKDVWIGRDSFVKGTVSANADSKLDMTGVYKVPFHSSRSTLLSPRSATDCAMAVEVRLVGAEKSCFVVDRRDSTVLTLNRFAKDLVELVCRDENVGKSQRKGSITTA